MISQDGAQVGMVPTEQALEMAKKAGLDLVEVAPNAKPPVCKIMDFNKLQYEKRRKAKESKKKSRQMQIKEIKFRPMIDPHDLDTKSKKARKFLERGDKVKLTLTFRGRQITHPELGHKVLKELIDKVSDIGQIEGNINKQGRMLSALLVSRTSTAGNKAEADNSKQEE